MTANVIGSAPQQQYVPLGISGQTPPQEPAPINATNTANVGSLAEAARADHVHAFTGAVGSRDQQKYAAMGFTDCVWDPGSFSTSSSTPTSQHVYGTLMGFFEGDTVNNIFVYEAGTLAAGTPPTAIYLALVSLAGLVLAVSANVANTGASPNWTSAISSRFVEIPMSAPYTFPANGTAYLCFLQNGTWGTTALTLKAGATAIPEIAFGSGAVYCVTQTGQTVFPTSPSALTLTADSTNFWFGYS
jgi:hypothetical protein